MKKNLRNRLLTALLILLGFYQLGFAQVSGDYRSDTTGLWDVASNWETFDGTVWSIATVKPDATNSVYIQSGDTMILSANEACNDLHLCNNTTSSTSGTVRGRLNVTSFNLDVNGKIRNYWGAVGVIPGTSFSTVTNQPYYSSGGKIRFVGNTRIIANTGEWGSLVNNPNSTNCDIEIALNPGEVGTFQTNFKAGNWTFTSGTMNILTVAADKSTTPLANITIGPDATVISSTNSNTFQKSGSGLAGALTVDGKLIFTGVTPKLQVTSIAFNGTVQYDLAGDQTLAIAGAAGSALPNTYSTLILSNSGIKTLGLNTTVNNSFSVTGTATLNKAAFSFTDKSANDITAFDIPLQVSSVIDASNHTVTVVMPFGTSLSALTPTIAVSPGSVISPLTEVEQNFSSALNYTVTAENSTPQVWTVTVSAPASVATDILSFDLASPAAVGNVDAVNHTVAVTVPYGTNVTALVPAITLSGGATVSALSGVAANFTSPVTYTVTAQDGNTKQDWTVTVTVASATATDILTFNFAAPAVVGTVDANAHTVNLTVAYGTNVTALIPAITLSDGATISPLSGIAQNFSSDVLYTVTAQDGITNQVWTVSVAITPASTETDILTFNFASLAINGIVNATDHTVVLTVPYGTAVSALVPTITLSPNASVSPLTGVAANFTSNVTYTVTAEDGITKQAWTVSVIVATNTQNSILSFSFAGLDPAVNGIINSETFTVTAGVPSGTDLSGMIASFTLSPQASAAIGTIPQVSGVTSNDFSSSKVYIVKAGNGSTQNWTVNVSIAGEPLAYDAFDYTAGELLSAQIPQGWATYSSAGVSEVLVASGNLSYPGLFPSQGNKISFDGAGTDINKSFTSQSAIGSRVYYSFILQVDSMKNVTSNAGAHFAGLSSATSTVGASVYFKWDGIEGSNKFLIGTAVRGASASVPVYTASTYDINKPILIVGCYEIVDGLLNDKTYMWINPSADDLGLSSSPMAILTAEGGAASDLTSLGYFYIRQDAATLTPYINMDELRIGLSWADVTPKSGVVTFNPGDNEADVDIVAKPTITFIKPIRKIGGAAISNSDLAGLITFKKNNASGASVPFTAEIDPNKQVITISPSASLSFSGTYYISVGSVEDNTGAVISPKNSKFVTRAARNNAALTDLKVNGNTVTGFDAGNFSYNISLDFGTTAVPSLNYTLSDANASALITNAPSLPGTSTVLVTAENGTSKSTYNVIFSVATTASSDATLSNMLMDGVTISGFASSTYEYLVALPFGTVVPPLVTVTTNSSVATAVVTQAQSMTDITFVEVTAQNGTTTLTYAILFEIDPYIYKIGFTKTGTGNNELPFIGWSTDNTIVSSNWGTLPIVNHGEFTGPEAFRFITGKSASVPPSSPGWMKTTKYPKSGILNFWLYVQASDGTEELLVHKKVRDADSVLVAKITSAEMVSANWKEFTYDINVTDSTAIIFTSVLTIDAATRIWMDDLSLKGKITTGISQFNVTGPAVNLYPNPAHEHMTIDMNQAKYGVMDIYNSVGSKVLSYPIIDSNFDLDVRNLNEGVYLILFTGKDILYRTRFVKF